MDAIGYSKLKEMESIKPDWLQKVSAKSQAWTSLDNFSPVVNDVTLRALLTPMLIKKWDAKSVDIDNAFLNVEFEHEIYMTIPEGYAECVEQFEEKGALKLEKAIYALVQAPRQFFKKI